MNADLEELKRAWIIDEDSFDDKKLEHYVKRMVKYCKITKSGKLDFNEECENKLPIKDKLKLILAARFLGNKLEESIPPTLSVKEAAEILLVDEMQIAARLKDLKDERIALREQRGVYRVNPSKINQILQDIEKKLGDGRER